MALVGVINSVPAQPSIPVARRELFSQEFVNGEPEAFPFLGSRPRIDERGESDCGPYQEDNDQHPAEVEVDRSRSQRTKSDQPSGYQAAEHI
jgi:hypothetical protein